MKKLLERGKLAVGMIKNGFAYERLEKYYIFFTLVLVIQMAIVVYPFVFSRIPIENEFAALPEQTILHPDKPEKTVDNTQYINQLLLFGARYKYDPRADAGNNRLLGEMCVKIKDTPAIKKFIFDSYFKYYYDERSQSMVAIEPMTPAERDKLLSMVDASEKTAVEKMFTQSNDLGNKLLSAEWENETYDFISKNMDEWAWQTRGQGIIHHKSFIFYPIRELEAGKPASGIYFQYGYGMAQLLRFLMKCVGGVTFTNFVRVIFPFYLVYFVLFIAAARIVLRRWDLVFICAALLVYGAEFIDFKMFYAYDGLIPIRYFFDVAVIGCYYMYCQGGSRRYKIAAYLFAALMLVHNVQFGMFLYLALICSQLYSIIQQGTGRRKEILWLTSSILFGLICYKLGTPGPDLMSKYFLAGFLNSVSSTRTYFNLVVFALTYVFLCWQRATVLQKAFSLFLLLYCQQMLTFDVIEGVYEVVMPTVAITSIYFLAQFVKASKLSRFQTLIFVVIASWTACNYAYPAIMTHFQGRAGYFRNINNHVVYKWNFPELDIQTDAEPQLVEESVELINKYCPSGMISMVSKYDVILLPASGKVSTLPYSDLRTYLFAESEYQSILQQYQRVKPMYFFVDTEITTSPAITVIRYARLSNILVKATGFEALRTVGSACSLEKMNDLWNDLAKDYEKVESGRLISVYRRKNGV